MRRLFDALVGSAKAATSFAKSVARSFDASQDSEADAASELLESRAGETGPAVSEAHALPAGLSRVIAQSTAVIGVTGLGKTDALKYLTATGLVSEEAYRQLHIGAPVDVRELKGYQLHTELDRSGINQAPRVLHAPPCYTNLSPDVQQQRNRVQKNIQNSRSYKLTSGYNYNMASMIFPPAESGLAGSLCFSLLFPSPELHTVIRVFPRATLASWCTSHLEVLAGRTQEGERDALYFKELWGVLVPRSVDVKLELTKYLASKDTYQPPFNAWVEKAAGQTFIFRTRQHRAEPLKEVAQHGAATSSAVQDALGAQAAGRGQHEADLLSDLVFILHVNTLMMAPKRMHDTPKRCAALLEAFAAEDSEGPWAEITAALTDDTTRYDLYEGLPAVLEFVGIGVPVPSLPAGGIIDTLGVNDMHTVRRMRQRQLERLVRNVLLMTAKTLMTSGELMAHLRQSPFVEAWIKERIEENNAGPERQLDIMLMLEKEGCNPDSNSDYDGNSTVNIPYLLDQGEHLVRKAQELCVGIRRDLVRLVREVMAEELNVPPEEVERMAPWVVSTSTVFYSFPLLGLALHQSPERLQQLGVDEAALQPEVLQRLKGLVRLDEFQAALMLPEARAVAQELEALDTELGTLLEETAPVASVFQTIHDRRNQLKRGVLDRVRNADRRIDRELWVGSLSNFESTFSNLRNALRGEVLRQVDKVFLASPSLPDQMAKRVMDQIDTVLTTEPMRRLLTMLHPTYMWEHAGLPLRTYIQREVESTLGGRMEEYGEWLEGQFQSHLVDRSIDALLKPTCLNLLESTMNLDKKMLVADGWKRSVDIVFHYTGVEASIRSAFQKSFMPRNKRTALICKKVLEAMLEEEAVGMPYADVHTQLTVISSGVIRLNPSDRISRTREVLHRQLHKYFKGVQDTLIKELQEKMQEQFRDLCMRLYERMVTKVKGPVSRTDSVFIPVVLQFIRNLQDLAEDKPSRPSGYASKLNGVVNAILNARNDIAQHQAPSKWLDALCEEVLCSAGMLDNPSSRDAYLRALDLVLNRLAQEKQQRRRLLGKVAKVVPSGPTWSTTIELPAEWPVSGSGSAAEASPKATTATAPDVAAADANWDRNNEPVTAEQMAAFHEHLRHQNLELLDCPGGANNCMLFAVGSQMLGIPLDAAAEPQVDHLRMRLASLQRRYLEDEAAMMSLPGCGVDTLGPDSWHAWIARQAGVDETDKAAVQNAARAHLDGVEGGAPLNVLDLRLLQLMLGLHNMEVVIYKPTLPAASGYRNVLIESQNAAAKREVHIANVWMAWERGEPGTQMAGARGELNHFMVVRPEVTSSTNAASEATPARKSQRLAVRTQADEQQHERSVDSKRPRLDL